uniref:Phosphodiesterase n=1 Tax=Panagrolaimus sp. ES5 TaxID=591445 RepID=A0AC34F6I7_9BILA
MNLATLSPSQNCRTTEISDSTRTSSSVSPSISSATSSINTATTSSDPTNIASSSSTTSNNSSINEPSLQNGKLSPPVASASLLDRQTMLLTAVTACSSRSRDPVEYSKEVADALKHCHCSKVAPLANGIIPNGKFDKNKSPSDCISPEVCKRLLSLSEDMNLLVRNITKEAKALVQAEICSLFLLDKENSELVAEVFEKNGTSDEYLTEIRMPLNQGIVGHVATTGEMMNVQNVYDHPSFYPKVDERTGFITRNILCFPIKDSSGNLVGVAELCNKIGKPAFTLHDEQIATTFAVYCAISISHCLLYRKLQEAHRRSHMAAELLVQGSTLSIAPEDILRLTVRDIPNPESFHPDFNKFCFVPRSIGTGDTYVEAALSMFKDLGFIDKYRLRRRTLARFLLMVQKGYRDVPYHNWSHAFAVGHFCYLLLRMGDVKSSLTDLERFSLLVACLCHDIDHRGTTNAFQLQSKTPLAQLYSSEGSVLERHHFAQTVTILGMDECNIFEQLTRQQYQQVLDNIREIILATDIAAHLRKVDRIQAMVENSVDHHYLLMCLLMTASDLSDQSKDFKNSKGIAENIYKEFFSQGDLEKQMGNRPIEMMDRERACVPKIQLEFMDTVALPVFRYISDLLPALHETYDSLMINRACWQSLDCILQEEGLPSGGLDYLKDLDLEQKVLDRVGDRGLTWKEEYARKDGYKDSTNPSDSAKSSTTSKSSQHDALSDDKPCSSKSLR